VSLTKQVHNVPCDIEGILLNKTTTLHNSKGSHSQLTLCSGTVKYNQTVELYISSDSETR
jgi:hypothetical protein